MAKNRARQGGGNTWGALAGSAVKKLVQLFTPGGYMPALPQQGSWLPMGEPAGGGGTTAAQRQGVLWGLGSAINIAQSNRVDAIMIESPAFTLPQGAAPTLQRLSVVALDGQMDMLLGYTTLATQAPTIASAQVSVGIYVSNLNTQTGLYAVQDPGNSADVSRCEWVFLESRKVDFSIPPSTGVAVIYAPAIVNANPKMFDFYNAALNVPINSGQALMLSVSLSGGGYFPASFSGNAPGAQLTAFPSIRGYITRVS